MDTIVLIQKDELKALVSSTLQEVLTENKNKVSQTPDPDQLLTVRQASEMTGYAIGTIYQLIFRKKIPFTKPGGGAKVLFRRGDLMDWIGQGRQDTPDSVRVQVDNTLSENVR